MREKSRIRLGPGAPSLILIFVVLGMSALGMLALMSARNDLNLTRRAARVAETVYALNERAEESRRTLDRVLVEILKETEDQDTVRARLETELPDFAVLEENWITWEEQEGPRRLECALRLLPPGSETPTAWARHRLVTELFEETEDLWD